MYVSFFKSLIGRSPVPDFNFAAMGFVQVAITRKYGPHTDLHKLERAYAAELRAEGCTLEQALSARWGGVEAIFDDMVLFDLAVGKGKKEAMKAGLLPQVDTEAGKVVHAEIYQAAADFALRCTLEDIPGRYGHFVNQIRANS